MTPTNRIRSIGLRALLALAITAPLATSAGAAAIINIINNDGPGEGFNDPTPVAPVGGNPGTTLGAQRLFVFQYAANIWGSILTSPVPISVRASFDPLTCSASSAVLGSTGATTVWRDFSGADFPGTWYVQSLANRLYGADLDTFPDMNSRFNSTLDGGTCLGGARWYYGIDGNEGTNVELLPVVLHETAHGLGFATTTNGTTGAFLSGYPSIYDRYLMDNTLGLHWFEMSATQRVTSAVSLNKLVWDGYWGTSAADAFLMHRRRMLVTAPAPIAGSYAANTASFGPQSFTVSGDVVLADDGTGTTSDACEPLINGPALAGKIALIDRGTCTFVFKAAAAQAAGAIAVIIANNVAGALTPGGADPTIVIPVVGISQADGATLKANLGAGVTVTLDLDPVLLAGADPTGRPLMYAPSPFQGGSSVSHWDVTMTPNALMEPAINNDLHDSVDITTALLQDIGWFPGITATTLERFDAEGREDGVLLRWRFSDPTDVHALTVERSAAATGPFAAVDVALGADGSSSTALDAGAPAGRTSFYRLHYRDGQGQSIVTGLAAAQRPAGLAGRFLMAAPAPNPSAYRTAVAFELSRDELVRLTVTDAGGRAVRTLHQGTMSAGEHRLEWDGLTDHGLRAPAGVYFIYLRTSEGSRMQRVAMVR